MLHIEKIVGMQFTALDPNTKYTCIGYGNTGTVVVFGAYNDTVNNRVEVKSFKLQEVKFLGQIPMPSNINGLI